MTKQKKILAEKYIRPSAQEVSKAIGDYLVRNAGTGGFKTLARLAGISPALLQKYAKGINPPPLTKWERLSRILASSETVSAPIETGLSEQNMEKEMMPSQSELTEGNLSENDQAPVERITHTTANNASKTNDRNEVVVKTNNSEALSGDLITEEQGWSRPEERQEMFLPVHGFTWFYPEEMDIIDHPAFQRLAGLNQLGMTYLVYRGATHRRIEHSIGAVGVAQRMLEAITHNCLKRNQREVDPKDQWLLAHPPTKFEKRFVRLATLLHDIGHVPFGHTIEDELRLLNKHDGEARVNRIFGNKIWHGKEMISLAELIDKLYRKYTPKDFADKYTPSELVKRIILKPAKEQTEDQRKSDRAAEESFAKVGLRVRICRDIVGDTICADLLDYLHRDWYHVGKPRYFDDRILHYMEIRTPEANKSISLDEHPSPTADDVFVISIGNRPKLRSDGISSILNLLESRYELAEAVLFHRAKMNATAMLERALSLAIPQSNQESAETGQSRRKKADSEQTKPDLEGWLLFNPEEALLPALLKGDGPVEQDKLSEEAKLRWQQASPLISRLLRRDLYQLLLMVTYDEFQGRDVDRVQQQYGDDEDAAVNRAKALQRLEKDFGLEAGSIVMYCPESRMNSKIAEVQLFVENVVSRFNDYESDHKDVLSAGHLKAQLDRFKSLWKIGFFIAPEVALEKGEEFLSQLRHAIRILVLNDYPRSESVETLTATIARNVVLIEKFHLFGKKPRSEPRPLQAARTDSSVVSETYPTGARSLLDFIETDGQSRNSKNT